MSSDEKNDSKLGKKFIDSKVIIESTDWNKKQASNTLKILTGSIILNLVLSVSLFISVNRLIEPHDTKYFAMDDNLTIMPLIALDKPYIDDVRLSNFVANSITDVMTFSYFNWEKHIHSVSKNFFYKGFQDLKNSLIKNGIIDIVVKSRLNLIASLDGAPVVVQKKRVNNIFTWFVKVPVVLSYESSKGILKVQHMEAKVVVQRVPLIINSKGVQIKQMIFSVK